jgi:hypothetical protein
MLNTIKEYLFSSRDTFNEKMKEPFILKIIILLGVPD